jgi:O-succinylbenzoate synthase
MHERRVPLLTLYSEGLEGWSECVALSEPSYTAETTDTAWRLLTELVLPRLIGRQVGSVGAGRSGAAAPRRARDEVALPGGDLLAPVSWIRGHPMALATVEMAAWDLAARGAGLSLASSLGGTREHVAVGIALGLRPSVGALAEAVARALEEGYARVKLKIAPDRDVDLLKRIRKRFPKAVLSADANCAYTLADAPRLKELDALDLQMLEQPLAHDDLVDHARLQEEMSTPICLDESIASERDAAAALALGSCRVVNLKPGRVGGLAAALRIHDMMIASSTHLWCGGMHETGIGRAHNLALASLPGFTLPGDISASRRYWKRDIVTPEHEVEDGCMRVPTGPGIGVEVDVERVEALTVRTATFG